VPPPREFSEFLILGCGFTGKRVARRLLEAGLPVAATARDAGSLAELAESGARTASFDALAGDAPERLRALARPGCAVLYSIPTVRTGDEKIEPAPRLAPALEGLAARIVYLSTTGVYGDAKRVDETTQATPASQRQRLRVEAEQAFVGGPWETLILRPAAIYGPGRGVHEAVSEGRYRLAGDGSNYVSRIHVDDLAAVAARGLTSDLTGAYPVADREPCPSREIAELCSELTGTPLPAPTTKDRLSETRRSDRRVDARAVFERLGLELLYPSYRQGIPAAIAERP